ncbi:sensory rhodopsin transducer [Bradyrhizobium sp. BWC-3-1]|nr:MULTISPECIES: sensory rhodopsin transducer [Bradyrhizobium]WOH61836.1 sensory rhodopsin transducer [Bradyrhizobium sp. BWC-3-1]
MTMQSIGRTLWAIPEGYIPSDSLSDAHDLVSHEAACFLNVGENDADVQITLFFENRDPVGPYRVKVPARRTLHLRFNDLTDPAPVPRDTSYASLIEASAPLIVQHTRLDSRQPGMALLSTIAYPAVPQ